MSKLDDLIKELCPDGVEVVPLWSVTIWDKRFNSVSRDKQPSVINYPYLLASELFSLEREGGNVFLLSTGERTGWTTEELAGDNLREGEVVTIPWGKSRAVTDCIKYYKGKFVTADNRIMTSRDVTKLSNKFLYYWVLTQGSLIDAFYRGSGIKHPDMSKVLDLLIPVPPLPVQAEIVRILDNFTALTAELTKKLTAELTKRRKQYEHYRESLLSDETIRCFDDSFLQLSLENLFETRNGYTPSKSNHGYWSGETIVPWFRMEDIREGGRILSDSAQHVTPKAIKGELYPAHSFVISTSATIGEHALIEVPFLANQRFTILTIKEQYRQILDTKYIFHYCYKLAHYCKAHLNQGNFASVDMTAFRKFTFSIPSIEIQRRIATILDRFDTLCNDLTAGLPAEIEARKKQYEHYRDKLLSFEPRR